jgi:hypothetical protein
MITRMPISAPFAGNDAGQSKPAKFKMPASTAKKPGAERAGKFLKTA